MPFNLQRSRIFASFLAFSVPWPHSLPAAMKNIACFTGLAAFLALGITLVSAAPNSQKYKWKNVKIGGGGGFVPGIVFNEKQQVSSASYSGCPCTDNLFADNRVWPMPEPISVAHTGSMPMIPGLLSSISLDMTTGISGVSMPLPRTQLTPIASTWWV